MIARNMNYVSVYNCLKYNCVQFYGVLTYVTPCTLNQEMVDSQIQYYGCWERKNTVTVGYPTTFPNCSACTLVSVLVRTSL